MILEGNKLMWQVDKSINFLITLSDVSNFMLFLIFILGPTVTTSRSRRDSDQSSHSNEVFSGGEEHKDEPYSPQAPVTTPGKDENAVKLVPAPPPSVNIWEKRKTQQTSPSQKQEESPSHPATRTSPAHGTGSQSREPPVSQSDDMDSSQSTRESQNQSASKPPSQSSKSRLSQNEVCLYRYSTHFEPYHYVVGKTVEIPALCFFLNRQA